MLFLLGKSRLLVLLYGYESCGLPLADEKHGRLRRCLQDVRSRGGRSGREPRKWMEARITQACASSRQPCLRPVVPIGSTPTPLQRTSSTILRASLVMPLDEIPSLGRSEVKLAQENVVE